MSDDGTASDAEQVVEAIEDIGVDRLTELIVEAWTQADWSEMDDASRSDSRE